MCIKGFVYRLSDDGDLDIDRNVSTASCRTSSGDGVDLLSTTLYVPVVLSKLTLLVRLLKSSTFGLALNSQQ